MIRDHDLATPAPWPIWLKVFWSLFGGAICFLWGLALWMRMAPRPGRLHDFVQEWTSAKNYLVGEPIYTDLRITIPRYLGLPYDDLVTVNAHPPTSVLVSIPFAELSYPWACFFWNLLSLVALAVALGLIVRRLQFSAWMLLPVSAFLLTSDSLAQQVNQGQFNLVLLLLLTAAWVADRNGRWGLSGSLVAIAAAIKIFPAFLLLYFLARRRWPAIRGFALTFLATTSLTCAVLGWESYRDYVTLALPQVGQFRDYWVNASATGFFTRLFDPASGHNVALWTQPAFAKCCSLAISGLIVAMTGWLVWRIDEADSRQSDTAFALCIVAMLLVSPVTWGHYFLLLLLPLAVCWRSAESWKGRCLVGTLGVLLLTIDPRWIWNAAIPGNGELAHIDPSVASPLATLTALGYQFYSLAAFFVLGFLTLRRMMSNSPAMNKREAEPIVTSFRGMAEHV